MMKKLNRNEQNDNQFQFENQSKVYFSNNQYKAQSNAKQIFTKLLTNERVYKDYGNITDTRIMNPQQQREQFKQQTGFPIPSELNSENQEDEYQRGYQNGQEQHSEEEVPFKPKIEMNLFYAGEQHNICKNLGCALQAYIKLNMSELISQDKDLYHFMNLGGRDKNRKQNYLGDQELQSFFKKEIGKQIAEQFIGNYQFSLPLIEGSKADVESCLRYIRKYVNH